MEFDELQKIWDSQNNQTMYAINEQAMYNRILAKKRQANHITNISEIMLIIVNVAVGGFMLLINLFEEANGLYFYLLSVWLFCSAFYFIVSRGRRLAADKRFDRSMLSELDHAISLATYQVRLSQYGRWSMLPMVLFLLLGVWMNGMSGWIVVAMAMFFVLVIYASRWEHGIYKNRRRELETLKEKLNSNAVKE